MSSPFRDLPIRPRAIDLLKQGQTPEAVHVQLVSEGADPEEVRAVLTDLVALLHQAAAMDPERLRGEAKWLFLRGAPVEETARHFVRVGVEENAARAEAERLYASFSKLRPCQRCGELTDPSVFVLDLGGFSICRGCNLRDEIGRSEQRGVAREMEAIGVLGGGLGGAIVASIAANAMTPSGAITTRPFCGRCRQPWGVHVSTVAPAARVHLDPSASWVCGQCGLKIA
ncbi:MAG TPA: hypothetical protein VIF62_26840 [Labilithrix sp.]